MSAGEINVLQATAGFAPYNLGGTEVYLEGLIDELVAQGVKSTVLMPRPPQAREAYMHGSTPVKTYPVNEIPAHGEMRDAKPHLEFDAFRALLRENKGAVYHQQSWSRGCGIHHLRAAHELGFRTVLTIHVAGNICLRGTMMKFGASACSGLIDERICGACWLQDRGMPKLLAQSLAALPLGIAKRARQGDLRLATALAARALGAERGLQFREMVENADRIVAVCQWLYDALVANGVSTDKLILSRQAISPGLFPVAPMAKKVHTSGPQPLKLLYVGRCDPIKGIDVLIRAVRSVPFEKALALTICAAPSSAEEREYNGHLRTLAANDPRISFGAPIPRREIPAVMADFDVLAVPSVCLETGPLVVLEAQAAGLFVLGSRLGGIAELMGEGDSGELVKAGDVKAWTQAIERLAELRTRGELLCQPRRVRTMSAVAGEMADLYRSLC